MKLSGSFELYAGALIFFAIETAGTSDLVTKPAANNAAWLEMASIEKYAHKQIQDKEDVVTPDPDIGWAASQRIYTLGDRMEITTRETTSLFHRLQFGLANAIAVGTAQTPAVVSDRMVRGWVKIQLRQHLGTYRYIWDAFCEVRVMGDAPEAVKGTQKPNLEFFVKRSTLNAFNEVT